MGTCMRAPTIRAADSCPVALNDHGREGGIGQDAAAPVLEELCHRVAVRSQQVPGVPVGGGHRLGNVDDVAHTVMVPVPRIKHRESTQQDTVTTTAGSTLTTPRTRAVRRAFGNFVWNTASMNQTSARHYSSGLRVQKRRQQPPTLRLSFPSSSSVQNSSSNDRTRNLGTYRMLLSFSSACTTPALCHMLFRASTTWRYAAEVFAGLSSRAARVGAGLPSAPTRVITSNCTCQSNMFARTPSKQNEDGDGSQGACGV